MDLSTALIGGSIGFSLATLLASQRHARATFKWGFFRGQLDTIDAVAERIPMPTREVYRMVAFDLTANREPRIPSALYWSPRKRRQVRKAENAPQR